MGTPAVKTDMTPVAGYFCSHIETVSQAVSVAMLSGIKRTRLNAKSCHPKKVGVTGLVF